MTRLNYGLSFLGLLGLETLIALYGERNFVRPFLGDVLVIGLIYAFLQMILLAPARRMVIGVVSLAFLIEIGQWFDFVALLGLQDSRVASVVLGRTFSWLDFLAYVTGGGLVLWLERSRREPDESPRPRS